MHHWLNTNNTIYIILPREYFSCRALSIFAPIFGTFTILKAELYL